MTFVQFYYDLLVSLEIICEIIEENYSKDNVYVLAYSGHVGELSTG